MLQCPLGMYELLDGNTVMIMGQLARTSGDFDFVIYKLYIFLFWTFQKMFSSIEKMDIICLEKWSTSIGWINLCKLHFLTPYGV